LRLVIAYAPIDVRHGDVSKTPPTRVQNINPPELGPAKGFAHATKASGIVWFGGQVSTDASGHVTSPGDIAAQFRVAVGNLRIALSAAGCQPSDVVKITYFVTDVAAYRAVLGPIGKAYREVFGHHYPATTLVGVSSLFDPDAMVEIECIAVCQEVGQ
jgi:enamine deaminase RidA (YjgF/YER057c/UK114 family)